MARSLPAERPAPRRVSSGTFPSATGRRAAVGLELREHAGVDGVGGFAVELLVDDGAHECLEERFRGARLEHKRADVVHGAGEQFVAGAEVGDGVGGDVVEAGLHADSA